MNIFKSFGEEHNYKDIIQLDGAQIKLFGNVLFKI